MKKLGINIDGVLRNFHSQFDKQYRKTFIHNPSIVAMNEEDMTFKAYTEDEEAAIEKKIADIIIEKLYLEFDSDSIICIERLEELPNIRIEIQEIKCIISMEELKLFKFFRKKVVIIPEINPWKITEFEKKILKII